MKNGPAKSKSATAEPGRPEIVEGAKLADLKQAISHAIAYRAYEMYEAHGRSHGHDLEDWFHAELDLTRPIPVEVHESSDRLTLRAAMSGFDADSVKVGVEPRRVLIWATAGHVVQAPSGDLLPPEVLRTVDLPAEVDPTRAEATLKDGVLDVSLPRAARR
jgi:HSP20 family molecular chaperone IbpA